MLPGLMIDASSRRMGKAAFKSSSFDMRSRRARASFVKTALKASMLVHTVESLVLSTRKHVYVIRIKEQKEYERKRVQSTPSVSHRKHFIQQHTSKHTNTYECNYRHPSSLICDHIMRLVSSITLLMTECIDARMVTVRIDLLASDDSFCTCCFRWITVHSSNLKCRMMEKSSHESRHTQNEYYLKSSSMFNKVSIQHHYTKQAPSDPEDNEDDDTI